MTSIYVFFILNKIKQEQTKQWGGDLKRMTERDF